MLHRGVRQEDIVLPHRLLLDAYTDQVRPLMEWALTDREEFTWPQWQWPVSNLGSYVVGTLGAVRSRLGDRRL